MSILTIKPRLGRPSAALLVIMMIVGVIGLTAGTAFAASPLTIKKTANPSPVASGQQLTYTLLVTNTGGSKVTEVYLVDVVNGMTGIDGTNQLILTSTVGSCFQSGNTVRCDAGTLQGFQSWTVTIRGVVTAANGTTLNNTASVTGTKSAQTTTVSDTIATQVVAGAGGPLADLTVAIKAPTTIQPSHDIVYTLTVSNLGSLKATDVVLTATLPTTVTFQAVNATNLFDCSPLPDTNGTITCTGGAVNSGANATVQIGVVAPNFYAPLTISAQVDPFGTVPEGNELNNSYQATTQVTNAPPTNTLSLEKTDSADPLTPYETLTYTINLANTSAYRADYITVVDTTQGLDAASVSVVASVANTSVPMTCTVSAPNVSCETTRFQPGATALITISGTVIQPAGTTIINTASVNGNIRNTGVTNSASTITTVRPAIDLTTSQYRTFPAPPAPVRGADRFDYTITVGNSGLYNANNVVVREPLPDGVLLDGFSSSAAGTTCTPVVPPASGGVVSCTIPVVKGVFSSGEVEGDTETITLRLIAPHAIGPITSTVTIDPTNAIPENDESNNTFETTTDVVTGIDLTVEKTENFDPIARNGTLQYTVTVTNIGTQDTDGMGTSDNDFLIWLRDVLPTGAVFRNANDVSGHNFTCSQAGGVVECVGGIIRGTYSGSMTLPPDFAVFKIDVFAPDEPGDYHNETRVDPFNSIPEKDETNNIEFENTKVENGISPGAYKELRIAEISDNLDPVATSGTLDYDITVANTGSADAFQVIVKSTLPAGSTFREANDTGAGPGQFSCTEAGGIVTCSSGTIKSMDTRGIRISTFAPPSPVTALLEVVVDPLNTILEADESNNEADETTAVQSQAGPGFGIYKDLKVPTLAVDGVDGIIDSFDPAAPDGILDYTIVISNGGSADAYNVTFRAFLPSTSDFRFADDQGTDLESFSCTESGGVVTCTGGRVNAGASRQVKIQIFTPTTPQLYRLDVQVDPDNQVPEGHEGNNTAEEFTNVALGGGGGFIDLQITKSSDPVFPAATTPGGSIEYTIGVTNTGTDDAFNVTVRDPLPAGVTFVEAVPTDAASNFVCQNNSGVVDCTGGYIKGKNNNGGTPGSREIKIRVKAPLEHGVTITNQAFVDPLNQIEEANESNNIAQPVKTKVESRIDLIGQMNNATIAQNTDGEWTFTVQNTGTDTARDVMVEANFSAGGFVVNAQADAAAPGWSCRVSENDVNKVVCFGDVAAGQTLTFSVTWHRSASQSGLESYVDVDPTTGGYGAIVESNEDNNRDVGTNS